MACELAKQVWGANKDILTLWLAKIYRSIVSLIDKNIKRSPEVAVCLRLSSHEVQRTVRPCFSLFCVTEPGRGALLEPFI